MTIEAPPRPPVTVAETLEHGACLVCGQPSDAPECNACVIADETAWKRRADR